MTVERLARLEERFDAYQGRAEREFAMLARLHEDNKQIIQKLDERLDAMDVFHGRLLATFGVVIVMGNLLAPVVLRMLGVTS